MNKLIKIKIIAIIGIFIISFLSHFIYTIFPNIITSILFPVNESIFEHMKIIFTSTIIYSIIDYILLKKENISTDNFWIQLLLTSFLGIIIYLILYLPIRYSIGEYLPISILLLFITYTIMQIVSYYLLAKEKIPYPNKLTVLVIIIIYIIFAILTYYPPHNNLFLDTSTSTYGINPLTKK